VIVGQPDLPFDKLRAGSPYRPVRAAQPASPDLLDILDLLDFVFGFFYGWKSGIEIEDRHPRGGVGPWLGFGVCEPDGGEGPTHRVASEPVFFGVGIRLMLHMILVLPKGTAYRKTIVSSIILERSLSPPRLL
jgi:hypothetical protein